MSRRAREGSTERRGDSNPTREEPYWILKYGAGLEVEGTLGAVDRRCLRGERREDGPSRRDPRAKRGEPGFVGSLNTVEATVFTSEGPRLSVTERWRGVFVGSQAVIVIPSRGQHQQATEGVRTGTGWGKSVSAVRTSDAGVAEPTIEWDAST